MCVKHIWASSDPNRPKTVNFRIYVNQTASQHSQWQQNFCFLFGSVLVAVGTYLYCGRRMGGIKQVAIVGSGIGHDQSNHFFSSPLKAVHSVQLCKAISWWKEQSGVEPLQKLVSRGNKYWSGAESHQMNIQLLTFMVGRRLHIELWLSEDRVEAFYKIIEGLPITELPENIYLFFFTI